MMHGGEIIISAIKTVSSSEEKRKIRVLVAKPGLA